MTKAIDDLKSPTRKIIAFLKKGRDDLRVKYSNLREKFRTAENQIRAVEKSREQGNKGVSRETKVRETKVSSNVLRIMKV